MNHKKNMRKERCYPLKKKKRKKDVSLCKSVNNENKSSRICFPSIKMYDYFFLI